MRRIIALLCITLVIHLNDYAQNDTTVVYKEQGTIFTYPKSWYLETSSISPNQYEDRIFSTPKEHCRISLFVPDSNVYAFISMHIKAYQLTKTFEEFIKNEENDYKTDGFTFYSIRPFKLNGLKAYEAYATWHNHQQPGEAKMWYVLDKNNTVTKITFETAPFQIKNFEKTVTTIFNSIKIF